MDKPKDSGHRPGDLIINKYMPDATPEQKEEARENLKALAAILLRIDARLIQEGKKRDEDPSLHGN